MRLNDNGENKEKGNDPKLKVIPFKMYQNEVPVMATANSPESYPPRLCKFT